MDMRIQTFLVSLLLLSVNVFAEENNIEKLIKERKWQAASQAIFQEAKIINPKESTIAINQARSGFLNEAIETANAMHPITKSYLLLEIVRASPDLPIDQKKALVSQALAAARAISDINYLRSDSLVKISLVYSKWNMETESKRVFNESISAAKQGLKEKGSGGCRRISDALVNEDSIFVKDWMIEELSKCIELTTDPFNKAFSYRDMAEIKFNRGDKGSAVTLLNKGFLVAKQIKAIAPRQAIASTAIQFGEIRLAKTYDDSKQMLPELAQYYAKQGDYNEALEIISKLGAGLYVNFSAETQSKIISEAIDRGDFKTAEFFVKRLIKCPLGTEVRLWTKFAELEAMSKGMSIAKGSYQMAANIVDHKYGATVYESEIRSALLLAGSMFEHGMQQQAETIVQKMSGSINAIPAKSIDDRISARTMVAEQFALMGKYPDAALILLRAYQSAHNYPTEERNSAMKKSALLSEIGRVAAQIKK